MLHYQTHLLRENAAWVVFIHGAGGSLYSWKYQIEAFKPYFNLLLLDLRDHGQSQDIEPAFDQYNFDIVTDDILLVIDHLEITKAHFLSVSLGSVILQKIEEKRTTLIDKMIMSGGVFRATFRIKFFVHSAKILSYFLPYRVMYDLFSLIVLPKKNHQKARRIFRLQSQKITPEAYMKWVGLYKDFFRLLRSFFKRELQSMSLVVMGEEDHVFVKAAEKFARTHHRAQLVIFEKCGHICNIEQYERFNQIVLAFLKEDGGYKGGLKM